MPTREIARSEWKTYFDEFSQARQGELITVELIFDPQADPQYALRRRPFVGLTFEEKDGETPTVQIVAGGETGDETDYAITHPVHVYHKNARGLISDEVNEDEVVEITSRDAPRIAFLRFEPAP